VASGKLFVGNLPWKISEETLKDHFSQCGEVFSIKIIKDKDTGRSKGFGFIEMNEHQKAIEQLNGTIVDGRPLVVSEAKPPKPRQ
jgi:RNA recognition motif-containing protein